MTSVPTHPAPLLLAALVILGGASAPRARADSCVLTPPGLVSWWPGEGNANDISDGNNAAVLGIAPGISIFSTGEVGQTFNFFSDAHLDVADNSNLKVQRLTLDAWIKGPPLSSATSAASFMFKKAAINLSTGAFDNSGYELSLGKDGLLHFALKRRCRGRRLRQWGSTSTPSGSGRRSSPPAPSA